MSRISYIFRETFSIFARFKGIFLLSLISSTLSLILLGSGIIGWLTISSGIEEWKRKVEIAVFLKDGVGQERVKKLFEDISNMEEVREVSYISKEEALSKFKMEMAQARMLVRSIGGNPLPDTLVVKLSRGYEDPEHVSEVAAKITNMDGVEEVRYDEGWIGRLWIFSRRVKRAAEVAGSIMVFVVLLSIYMAIRAISRERSKDVMLYRILGGGWMVGKMPGAFFGLITGIIAGALSLGILYYLHLFLLRYGLQTVFLTYPYALAILGVGGVMGFLAGILPAGGRISELSGG